MHQKNIVWGGRPLAADSNVLIMLHGRGGSGADILSLAPYLNVAHFTLLAPQATNATWYPYSFLAPPQQNEPWLSAALALLQEIVHELTEQGIASNKIYLLGFSQGACLALEFAARHATRYGGVVAFTGGLIGNELNATQYRGDFAGTPIFIGTANPDPHVPLARVQATTAVLRSMHARVTEKVYNGMGHTISHDEISEANKIVFAQAMPNKE